MALTKHLQEVIEKQIPQRKWFTKDDVILITRTQYVLDRLVNEGVLKKEWRFGTIKYYYSPAKNKTS